MANYPIYSFSSCWEFLMAMDRFNPYIHSHSHSLLNTPGSPIHWPFRVFSLEACVVCVALGIILLLKFTLFVLNLHHHLSLR